MRATRSNSRRLPLAAKSARRGRIPFRGIDTWPQLVEFHVLEPLMLAGRHLLGEQKRVRLVVINVLVDLAIELYLFFRVDRHPELLDQFVDFWILIAHM